MELLIAKVKLLIAKVKLLIERDAHVILATVL